MSEPIKTVVDSVSPYVPDCPDFIIEEAVRRAYRDFCMQTRWIHREIEKDASAADVVGGVLTIHVGTVVPDHVPVAIRSLLIGTGAFKPVYNALPMSYTPPESAGSRARHYHFPTSDAIALYPLPEQDTTVRIGIDLVPISGVTTLSPEIYPEWEDALEAGTISRLMRYPDRPWSNPGEAQYYHTRYWTGISSARNQMGVRRTGDNLSVKMRPFV